MKNEIQSSKELPNKICINYKGYKGNFTQWRSLIDQPESSDRLEHHPQKDRPKACTIQQEAMRRLKNRFCDICSQYKTWQPNWVGAHILQNNLPVILKYQGHEGLRQWKYAELAD